MRTQWRTGPGGPIGLDYAVMLRKLDRLALDPDAYDDLESRIQIMENAALGVIHQKD